MERGRRDVSVAELLALVVALRAPVEQLLDPRGPEGIDGATLALTSRGADPSLEVEPGEVHGLICAGASRPVLATLTGMIGWTR